MLFFFNLIESDRLGTREPHVDITKIIWSKDDIIVYETCEYWDDERDWNKGTDTIWVG